MIQADAFILGYKRDENMPKVIEGLRRQSMIKTIYVFHNAPSKLKIPDVINIYSEKNFGCIVRHALALIGDESYVFFADDDLELMSDFSERFTNAVNTSPDSIVGLCGKNLHPEQGMTGLYEKGDNLGAFPYYRFVDIVKGRVHLCHKKLLVYSFDFASKHEEIIKRLKANGPLNMDDIILNLSSQLKTKVPSVTIPFEAWELKNLEAPFAVSIMENHIKIRDQIILDFLKLGWKPQANRKNFTSDRFEWNREKMLLDSFHSAMKVTDLEALQKIMTLRNLLRLPRLYVYNYAGLLKEASLKSKALKIYQWIIKRDEDKELIGLSCFHIGSLYLSMRKIIRAKKYLKRCIELLPDHAKAKELLELPDLRNTRKSFLQFGIDMHILTQNKIKYFGLGRFCPVCKSLVKEFLPTASKRPDVFCPVCGCRERHRLFWLYLNNETNFLKKPLKMLHVAPENCFIRQFKEVHGKGYFHIDIASTVFESRMDLTDLKFADFCFDFFFCSHVLEHIEDDVKAISEIFRVLKNKGTAIIMVPIFGNTTQEDKSVKDPGRRKELYGQADHVRSYGEDFILKLKAAGFKVKRVCYREHYPTWLARFYGLTGEILFHCTKENS